MGRVFFQNRIRLPFFSFVLRDFPLKHFPDGYVFVAKQVKQLQNSYNSTQNSNNVLPLNAVNHWIYLVPGAGIEPAQG